MARTTAAQMVAAARERVPAVTPEEARAMPDALIVDLREPDEIAATGRIAGAAMVPRGWLEWRADPDSPWHDPRFELDRPVLLYCAVGGRAAMAGVQLQDLGFRDVRNLGGFQDWADKGFPIEKD
jgi:rhodanese-related sulfurtransferase